MDKEYIEIRSNIVDGFNAHIFREIQKVEEEKQERARKLELEKAERLSKYNEWKESHPNCATYGLTNEYNFNQEYAFKYGGIYCKVSFFEWGDINRSPRIFYYLNSFLYFLDECGLFLTPDQAKFIKDQKDCYITCKPHCKELVISTTYDGLKDELEHNPVIPAVNNVSSI